MLPHQNVAPNVRVKATFPLDPMQEVQLLPDEDIYANGSRRNGAEVRADYNQCTVRDQSKMFARIVGVVRLFYFDTRANFCRKRKMK